MKLTAKAVLVLAWAFALGCGDDASKIDLPSQTNDSPVAGETGDDAAGAPLVASCDGAPIGTRCGKAGQRKHCLFDACVKNACGDGWPAYGEKCDDGDEIDGDGCSAYCTLEVAPGCGNDVLEPGEQCDDGNTDSADGCTADCKNPRCGDGVMSRGEECDDGNVSNGDACTSHCRNPQKLCGNGTLNEGEACDDGNKKDGDDCEGDCTLPPVCGDGDLEGDEECDDGNLEDDDSCTSTCELPEDDSSGGASGSGGATGSGGASEGSGGATGSGGANGSGGETGSGGAPGTGGQGGGGGEITQQCLDCRELNCHVYFSGAMDALSGCVDVAEPGPTARVAWTPVVFTPAQVQTCIDAVACAHEQGCGIDSDRPAAACYCGAAYANNGDCGNGAAGTQNGPCKAEFEAATGKTVPSDVMLAIGVVDTPAGWAYNLLKCEADFCAAECAP